MGWERSSAKVSRCRLDCYCDYERPQERLSDLENVDVMSLTTDKSTIQEVVRNTIKKKVD